MQFKKIAFSITALLFLAVALFIVPQTALAKGPVFGSDWMPPGLAKKMLVQQTAEDVKGEDANTEETNEPEDEELTAPQKGPAWGREEHPSVKGLKNAYRNLCRNGAPEWLREQFRQKIMARGGTVEDIDEIEEKEYTIAVDGNSKIELKFEQSVDITFLIEDSDAKAANLPADYEIKLQVSDEDNVLTAPEDGDRVDMSNTLGVTEAVTVTAGEENEGTATIKAILYDDQGEAVDSETIKVIVGEAVATTGSLTSEDSDLTFTSDGNKGPAYVAKAGGIINFAYQIMDQEGDPFDVTEDTNIIWTVKNIGEHNIYVNGVENAPVTVRPDEEKEFTEKISVGNDVDTITIRAYDVTEVEISAQMEENEDSLATTGILFYHENNELVSDSDTTITGTVKAFAAGENNNDGTQILLYDGDDYFYIPAMFETVIIESNDEDIPAIGDEAELEEYLEYNMEVKIWLDEYEEDDSADEDSIKLYLN